jgi:hypothetical protein
LLFLIKNLIGPPLHGKNDEKDRLKKRGKAKLVNGRSVKPGYEFEITLPKPGGAITMVWLDSYTFILGHRVF